MPPMPPMSGIPPPAAPAGAGRSATIASVVINNPAIDAASSKAVRVTLAGSMTPKPNKSPYSSVCALKPNELSSLSRTFPATTAPSTPAFSAIWRSGASKARRTIPTPAY